MTEPLIGLFYGSTTCYTEMTAEKIQQELGSELVAIHNIKDVPLTDMQRYQVLILGISTWDFGEIQEDWESHWQDIRALDLSDKWVAIYGQGDQLGYADWYQDALGMLHDEVLAVGGKPMGYTSVDGHEFAASKAVSEDGQHFVGLALDDENQFDQSEQRIRLWCEQLLNEMQDNL